MSAPWPTHKNIQLNQQLNKHLQNGTHTIRYCWILESVSHWHARSSTEAPDAEQYCSRHCAFKLSGFMDHNIVDVKKSLNLCVDKFQTLNPMRNRLKQREINKT